MSEAIEYEIENVGGIAHATLRLLPGVNVLRGENGAGKTSAYRAISRAQGAKIELERRDGTQHGSVRGPGVTLRVGKVVRATGHAELSLADVSPLSTLIDPQIQDPEAAARARLRALVELLRLSVTDEAVSALCGGDAELAAWVAEEVQSEAITDLLGVSEKARRRMHALAREQESAAERAAAVRIGSGQRAGEILEALGGDGGLTETPVEQARGAVADGGRRYERALAQCEAREALEARQTELRATIGERPDPEPHLDEADRKKAIAAQADVTIEEIEEQLEKLRGRLTLEKEIRSRLLAEQSAALDAASETQSAAERWDEAQTVLAQEATGPTRDELGAIQTDALETPVAELERAEHSASYRAAVHDGRDAAEAQEAAELKAKALRELAAEIPDRLGRILAEAGAPGLTIVGGRVHALTEQGAVDFEKRLSDGQRVRLALSVAAHVFGRGSVVPLDGAYWTTLDPANRAEFAALAGEYGLTVLTEEATGGGLRIEHVEALEGAA